MTFYMIKNDPRYCFLKMKSPFNYNLISNSNLTIYVLTMVFFLGKVWTNIKNLD